MAVTREDLIDFTQFAGERIKKGQSGSLVKLAGEWEAQRGSPAIQGIEEIDAETLKLLAAAFPEELDDRKLKAALGRTGGVTTAEMLRKARLAAGEAPQG